MASDDTGETDECDTLTVDSKARGNSYILLGEDATIFVRDKKLTSDLSIAIRFEIGREKARS